MAENKEVSEIEYEVEDITPSQVNDEIRETLELLKSDEDMRQTAMDAEISLAEFDAEMKKAGTGPAIEAQTGAGGFGVVETIVITAGVNLTAKVIFSVWEKIILPRIQSRHGVQFNKVTRREKKQ